MAKESLFYILIFILCTGCKNEKYKYNFPIFPITYKATTTMITTEIMFSYYMQPLLVDSLLIIPDVNQDTILNFYNVRSGKLIKQAAIKGKGPGELTLPTRFSMDYSQKQLYAFDYAKKSVIRYDIKQIINDIPPFSRKYLYLDRFYRKMKSIFERLLISHQQQETSITHCNFPKRNSN